MSFSDMMSSGRGPGVVGLVMGLIVIGGFGAIYVFVFDKEMQNGGKSIAAQVRDQNDDIETLKAQITHTDELVKSLQKGAEAGKKADTLATDTAATKVKLEELVDKTTQLISDTSSIENNFHAYRSQYRTQVREEAVGEKVPELKTVTGKEYLQVEIREVTEVGIGIRHEGGSARVNYGDLTPEWQLRFQYDPKEMAEALAREEAARKAYEESVSAVAAPAGEAAKSLLAEELVDVVVPVISNVESPESQEQIRRLIDDKEVQLGKLKTQLGVLQGAAVMTQAEEEKTRGKGDSGMAQVRNMRERIHLKEREIAKCVRELSMLKSQVRR